METILELKRVSKVFGTEPQRALQLLDQGLDKETIFEQSGQTLGVVNVNFEVKKGEIFVIMGLSGSGKSTLVRLLNRLIEPSRGEILVNGRDVALLDQEELLDLRRRQMSMVFQSFALMPHMTVLQNVAFGLELGGMEQQARESRAVAVLEQVGLAAWAERYPDELSGGMQQRVGLARALANDPLIMLMDEAFSALDPLIRSEMQEELLKLQKTSDRTIIFISHDLSEAVRIGDRIAIMEGGRVVQVGTAEEILRNPADDYVAAFFRGVDVTTIFSAGDLARRDRNAVIDRSKKSGVRQVMEQLDDHDHDYGYVVDNEHHYCGVVSTASLRHQINQVSPSLSSAYIDDLEPLAMNTPLNDVLGPVANAPCAVPVVDEAQRYLGSISRSCLLEFLDREQSLVG